MSLLTVADARARGIGTGLTDPQLQARIDDAEALLAARIGPLTGSRVTTFLYPRRVWLPRPAEDITVTDAGALLVLDTDYQLGTQGRIVSLNDGFVYDIAGVAVEWTPTDGAAVKAAVAQLVGVELAPFQSESIGPGYSYSRGATPAQARDQIVASLVYGRGTGL